MTNSDPASPDVAPPVAAARLLTGDLEAIEAARELARFAEREAARRDRERVLPWAELELFTTRGLGGMSIPRAYGGPGLSWVTVAEVFAIVSAADPSLGQIPQNQFGVLAVVQDAGSEAQKRRIFANILDGWRIGNAGPERSSKNTLETKARLTRDGDAFRLNGEKFYSTGALFAHWVSVKAVDDEGRNVMAFVRRGTPGLRIVDDWSGFGQRTTASGTVQLENVRVGADDVIPSGVLAQKPSLHGPISQLIQAAIDLGIARGAIADTIAFVRERTRPWIDAGVEAASREPFTIAEVGKLEVELHAAEALLVKAARTLDTLGAAAAKTVDAEGAEAAAAVDAETVARASIAVAEAKVLTTEVALSASEKLFELAGSRATLAEFNLDRHWRNARTHTVHDPVRWKCYAVGDYYLNGTLPARHAWI
ncbi:SfnB family sulfur acquisition oxidoreductase [Pendulispora albinea]|uniref:SfnB family sulfur acquisition oxidoreductase n=1 Tax=Pendulispora albinea TaxID=2741071 RepID=A0ABZ2LZT6_9BACT